MYNWSASNAGLRRLATKSLHATCSSWRHPRSTCEGAANEVAMLSGMLQPEFLLQLPHIMTLGLNSMWKYPAQTHTHKQKTRNKKNMFVKMQLPHEVRDQSGSEALSAKSRQRACCDFQIGCN
eukprot:5194858-Amphidinium_carterae.1